MLLSFLKTLSYHILHRGIESSGSSCNELFLPRWQLSLNPSKRVSDYGVGIKTCDVINVLIRKPIPIRLLLHESADKGECKSLQIVLQNITLFRVIYVKDCLFVLSTKRAALSYSSPKVVFSSTSSDMNFSVSTRNTSSSRSYISL
mgnify:CR=1 FL=1